MISKKYATITFFFFFISIVCATAQDKNTQERKWYAAKNSTEAIMTFDHEVEIENSFPPDEEMALEQIEKQLTHLFGPMGTAEYKSVPRGNHKISNVEILPQKGGEEVFIIRYHYTGTIVLENGPGDSYQIILPNNPDTIYEAGMIGEKTPCTDHHYNTAGDFWYFWNPYQGNCPLEEGTHFKIVKTKIKRLKNTPASYPEYERLVDNSGTIRISILMGMDNPEKSKDPMTSEDLNAQNYRKLRKTLINDLNFTAKRWTRDQIFKISLKNISPLPYVEEFTKKNKKAAIVIRLFFGPSGINEESQAFHYFFKDSLESDSIMIYNGHSGLGGHLKLSYIEQAEGFTIQPNRNKYQIYFFDSCSSYPYYNTDYFRRKKSRLDPKGTKNLDIFTNGLSTYFHVLEQSNLSVIKSIDAWANDRGRISYQKLSTEIDSDNLFGINGDEDNE